MNLLHLLPVKSDDENAGPGGSRCAHHPPPFGTDPAGSGGAGVAINHVVSGPVEDVGNAHNRFFV